MTRSLIIPIALMCTLACATQAKADAVSFSGFANGSQTVDIVLGAPNVATNLSTQAGGFLTTLNGGSSFRMRLVSSRSSLLSKIFFPENMKKATAPTA